MKNINIIQLVDTLKVGGAEVLAVNISNALFDKGVNSHLCATRQEGPLKENLNSNVGYLFLNRKSTLSFKSIFILRDYIVNNNITIVQAHSTSYFISICVKLFLPKLKILWHNHTGANTSLKGFKLFFLKFCCKYFDYIINVNEDLDIWSKNILKKNDSSYVRNFPFFVNHKSETKLFGQEGKRIVCLAGLRKEKDHINLLNAFLLVLKHDPYYTLHIVGKDYNDNYSKIIHDFVRNQKLVNHVFFYNLCTDIKNILEQSDIGVLSSESEGLPIALLEYGLAKIPVVCTDVGECYNIINNSKVIVPSKNSNKLANAIITLISDIEIKNKIALKLHNNVINNYSVNNSIKNLIDIYCEILS
jgi:glycosyltransferase involved in cell wall biosynthesis